MEDMDDIISDSDIEMSLTSEDPKPKTAPEFVYKVLSIEEIGTQMKRCIDDIKSVVPLSSAAIRTLLKHFKWDKQKLLERLFDGDEEKLFREIGLVSDNSVAKESKAGDSKRRRYSEILCLICYLDTKTDSMFGLDCDHLYCRQCWTQYLTTKIMSEGDVMAITCAHSDCKLIIDDEDVLKLIADELVKAKYQRLTTNSFVESNRLLRWCPRPDCLHAFSVVSKEAHPVTCVCGTQICFGCGEANHEPIGCHLLREWNIKSAGNNSERIDGKTANWIITNTKECPKCRTTIEKNGGCNHMTCRSIKCKYEFCWVCLDSWSTHGTSYYNCNLYNENKVKDKKSSQSEGRKCLERYMFYWTRFMNHQQSLRFENELKSSVKSKMTQMQDRYHMTWVEVQFMERAVEVLCSCRQTLMFTYVFAFYNERTQQMNIFEDNQRDLQKAVETLSEYLERDEKDANDDNHCIRSQVLHSSNYCQNRRKALIDHIMEGNEKEWWKYNFE
ncbi:unnamed protein product [Medioppia subpectinata]|uniref:RBR-type E3 ubiquitin transferase n=1 Tax=Medioppia subpectinata TaxID=1979941 RepID=A0A7R9L5C5_9ACAR|nr:unnamed protein product [Medioppia subpectinata]CAG2114667.1 unnamed protein product [Medioppia subpectinata]